MTGQDNDKITTAYWKLHICGIIYRFRLGGLRYYSVHEIDATYVLKWATWG